MTQIIEMMKQDPLFRSYFFYCAILVLKMMFMSALTGMKRIINKVFINPEDAAMVKGKISTSEKVERVRRAHLNDLENIPIFFVAAFAFCLTGPSLAWANLLFRAYVLARIVHTLVYAVVPMPQPSRGIAWFVGFGITGYMALTSILHFMA